MHIKKIKLNNIQSWDSNSPEIELSVDKLNTFIAPSETGKSVLIKVLKEMCFPGNWGYNRQGLIRRGCSYGTAAFTLEDNTVIGFILMEKTQRYAIIRKDDNGKLVSKDFVNETEIPEEIADLMGLIVDRKAKTIINVLDKDMPKPLVTTNPKLSGRIIATVTENPQLEQIMKNLTDWTETLEPLYAKLRTTTEIKQRVYENAPEKDETKINQHLILAKRYLDIFENVSPALELLLNTRRIKIPNFMKDLGLEEVFSTMNLIKNIIDDLTYIKSLKENTEKVLPAEINDYYDIFLLTKDIKDLTDQLNQNKIPETMKDIHSIKTIMDYFNSIKIIQNDLIKIQDNPIPQEMKSLAGTRTALKILNLKLTNSCDLYKKGCNYCRNLNTKLKASEEQLKAFEKELGICPLCGQQFKQGD